MNIELQSFLYTLFSGLFMMACTLTGVVSVFFSKKQNLKVMCFMMSFSSGIMLASSFFSLILPALAQTNSDMQIFLHVVLGALAGFLFMLISEKFPANNKNASKFSHKRITLSLTLHNIPEGMCVGVAFAFAGGNINLIASAIALALGIGIQNIPEGASVSWPVYISTKSKKQSFWYGFISAVVEPLAAVIAYIFAQLFKTILPFLLVFAAACMIYVSCVELLPESHKQSKLITATGMSLGFIIMMLLDLLL